MFSGVFLFSEKGTFQAVAVQFYLKKSCCVNSIIMKLLTQFPKTCISLSAAFLNFNLRICQQVFYVRIVEEKLIDSETSLLSHLIHLFGKEFSCTDLNFKEYSFGNKTY